MIRRCWSMFWSKCWTTWWTIALGLLAALPASAADFDIPPQSLSVSLQQLAKQTGIQIIAFSRVVDGRIAHGLHGAYTPEAALAALLDGTDLTYQALNDRAFEVTPRPTGAAPAADKPARAAVIDEVAVTAQLEKLSQMRAQIQKLEDEFFARYNELNTNSEYDVTCRVEARTGRHVMTRVCLPAFAVQTEKFKDGRLSYLNADLPFPAPMSAKTPDYQKNMAELVKQYPELFELLQQRDTLARRYETTRKRKLAGKIYVWD